MATFTVGDALYDLWTEAYDWEIILRTNEINNDPSLSTEEKQEALDELALLTIKVWLKQIVGKRTSNLLRSKTADEIDAATIIG